jgi:hypothetical protein
MLARGGSIRAAIAAFLVAACGSASESGPAGVSRDGAACGAGGHVNPLGHCVYPVPETQCTSQRRYDNGQCVPGNWAQTCGCAAPLCQQTQCVEGECVRSPTPDGESCIVLSTQVAGICHDGQCCFGCWDGTTCQPGTAADACGTVGLACHSCVAPCEMAACTRGSCANQPVNGPGCPPCGGLKEPCCAGRACAKPLACEVVIAGEDYAAQLCEEPDAGTILDASEGGDP